MLLPRLVAGLGALVLLACEVSTPPAQPPPSPSPAADAPAVGPGLEPDPTAEPGPPPEPPWPTAAGLAYREVVLGTADAEQALPMIVAIHGLGDTPDNFRHLLDEFPEPVRLILPRGIDPTEGGGWSWFPIRARDPDVEALAQGIAHAADRIAAGVEELRQQRPTVGKPIVTGFSQGGMLSFTLAVQHPELFGHAVAIGGWLPPPLLPAEDAKPASFPIDAFNGTDDKAVAYEPTAQVVQALDDRGLTVQLHSYEGVGHMITPQMRRDVFDRLSDAVADERRRKPRP